MEIPKFLKQEGDSLLYNDQGEFFFYIPEVYFEREYVINEGEFISMIGIADYSIRNKPDDPTYYGKNLVTFNFPTVFLTKPYKVDKVKNLKLENKPGTDYRVLRYRVNDPVVVSVMVPNIMDNVEDFYRIFVISAKIPSTIKYGTIWEYFPNSMALNGASYNISAQCFGLIERELCRDPNDLSKPFRLSSKKDDPTAYNIVSIKELPKYVSAYTALTSENWDESIIAASMNDNKVYTPLEKVLMQ